MMEEYHWLRPIFEAEPVAGQRFTCKNGQMTTSTDGFDLGRGSRHLATGLLILQQLVKRRFRSDRARSNESDSVHSPRLSSSTLPIALSPISATPPAEL
jgi:hypothetical protein